MLATTTLKQSVVLFDGFNSIEKVTHIDELKPIKIWAQQFDVYVVIRVMFDSLSL